MHLDIIPFILLRGTLYLNRNHYEQYFKADPMCCCMTFLNLLCIDRRALRSGGDGDEKLVALPSDGEDESEASDSGEDQISSGSDS